MPAFCDGYSVQSSEEKKGSRDLRLREARVKGKGRLDKEQSRAHRSIHGRQGGQKQQKHGRGCTRRK
jgi:hypothetical protein